LTSRNRLILSPQLNLSDPLAQARIGVFFSGDGSAQPIAAAPTVSIVCRQYGPSCRTKLFSRNAPMMRLRARSSWLKNLAVPGWVGSLFRRRNRPTTIRTSNPYRRPEIFSLEDRSFFNSFMAAAAPLAVVGTGAAVLAQALVRPAQAESLAVLSQTPSSLGSGGGIDTPSAPSTERLHDPTTTIQTPELSLPSEFLPNHGAGPGTALALGPSGDPGTEGQPGHLPLNTPLPGE
jgi:hypothetical protein